MKKIIGLCVLILMSGGIDYNAIALQGLSIDRSPDKRLDEKIKSFVAENKIPGLAIAIVKNNELYFANAYGVKNLDTREPVTTDSIFHMASVSKPFTATAIMQLVEKGKINLDDPLIKYLPYFKLDDPRHKEITIKQMLTHTSGIPDVTDYEWYKPQYDDGAAERYVRSLVKEKMIAAPGERYRYSNMAFDILADVIAKVSGLTFEDYIKENILNPLDMKESDFLRERIKPGLRTTPHIDSKNPQVGPVYPYNRYHAPSSCLNANVLEMSNWAMANMNKGVFKEKRILSESSYKLLFEPQAKMNEEISIGLSWFLGQHRNDKAIAHSGRDLGFQSHLIMIPEKRIAVIVAANCETNSVGQLSDEIIEILLEIERQQVTGKNNVPLIGQTFDLPPSVLLSVPNHLQEPDAPPGDWSGESCIQMGMAYYQKKQPQKAIHSAGKPEHSSLWSREIEAALDVLGVQYTAWDRQNPNLAEFLVWIKTNLAKGYPVLCGIKMYPDQHPDSFCDHFVLVVGYNEGGLFVDTNVVGDGRVLVTYSQLASLINRYSFENQYHHYFGSAFIRVKEPVAVDASKLKRLAGRYMKGSQARIITFNGGNLFSHWAGENLRRLITLSETEFRFADSDIRLRFELSGDRAVGVYRRLSDKAPEEPTQKRMEPLEDKNPEVTALVQKCIREAIEGTLKPEVFTPNLAAQIFPDQVKEAGAFFKSLGPQTGIELFEREVEGGGYRYIYRLSYGDKHVILRLSLMEDKRISAVDYYLE